MNTPLHPSGIMAPAAAYSHGVVTSPGSTLLHTSGTVPVGVDGTVPSALAEQVEQVWINLAAILDAGGFTFQNVVSVTTYVVVGQDLGVAMAARDRALAGHLAASTLVTVPALARPEWLVEVALVAAR